MEGHNPALKNPASTPPYRTPTRILAASDSQSPKTHYRIPPLGSPSTSLSPPFPENSSSAAAQTPPHPSVPISVAADSAAVTPLTRSRIDRTPESTQLHLVVSLAVLPPSAPPRTPPSPGRSMSSLNRPPYRRFPARRLPIRRG